jgi:acyl-CoA oxidase
MSQFSCFYANLITKGKEEGFHVFLVQLRDENHHPMPGVEVGEVGPKIGDNGKRYCTT